LGSIADEIGLATDQTNGLRTAIEALHRLGDPEGALALAALLQPWELKLQEGEGRLSELRAAKQASLPPSASYQHDVRDRDRQLAELECIATQLSQADAALPAISAKRKQSQALQVQQQQQKLVRLLLKAETAAEAMANEALPAGLRLPSRSTNHRGHGDENEVGDSSDDDDVHGDGNDIDVDDGRSDSTGYAPVVHDHPHPC
jgi:hypothetical protein